MRRGPQPTVTLALSSGIALTMAHIGVIHALEEAKVPVGGIVGSSGGAFVGALYAAGLSVEEMTERARGLRWRDLADLRVPRMGFFSNEKLEKYMEAVLGPLTFADLKIPLGVVCCNLTNGEEVLLREGRVSRAVRATCSIPQIFSPVDDNGRLLCDGGVLNKVPTQAARALGGDIVIAVDVGMHSRKTRVPTNIFGVVGKVMSLIAEDRAERERALADICVTPNLVAYPGFEMGRADEIIAIGRAAMEARLPDLHAAIDAWIAHRSWTGRLRAWWRGEPEPTHALERR